jgi:hypothetical protein
LAESDSRHDFLPIVDAEADHGASSSAAVAPAAQIARRLEQRHDALRVVRPGGLQELDSQHVGWRVAIC